MNLHNIYTNHKWVLKDRNFVSIKSPVQLELHPVRTEPMAQRVLYAQTETDPIWWVYQTHLVLLPLPFLLHHYAVEVVG